MNFAIRIKLYSDWAADPRVLYNALYTRKKLLEWVPVMAKSSKYNVQIDDFVQLEFKERRARRGSPGPVEPDCDEDYLFLGMPTPSPPAAGDA